MFQKNEIEGLQAIPSRIVPTQNVPKKLWFLVFKQLTEGTTEKIKSSITSSTSHAAAPNCYYLWSVMVSPGGWTEEIPAQETACGWEVEDKVGIYAIAEFFAFSELMATRQRTFIKIKFFIVFFLLIFLFSAIWLFCGDPLYFPTCLLPFPALVVLSSRSFFNQFICLALGQLCRSLTLKKQLMGKVSGEFLL